MIKAVLFDFDGVIANTESQYDCFFEQLGEKLHFNIPDFAARLKGTRLPEALDKQFPQLSESLKKDIVRLTYEFELQMNYPLVPGVIDFIQYLRKSDYKIALVTSSDEEKMQVAMEKLNLTDVFDSEVMSGRIDRGKPDPSCYLLAASDLQVSPSECLVFEDSRAGVQAGIAARMHVVGVATTLPADVLKEYQPDDVISDFQDMNRLLSCLSL